MTFNYNPALSSHQLPMMPMLGGLPAGSGFMAPSFTSSMQQQMSTAATPGMLAAMAAGMNDQPLEFNGPKKTHTPAAAVGAGPMDLETITEQMIERERSMMRQKSLSRDDLTARCSADRRLDDASNGSSLDSSEKSTTVAMAATMSQADVLRMMGIPQNLMMVPVMNMMDAATSMMGMQQQYSMMGQLSQAAQQNQLQQQPVQVDDIMGTNKGISMKEVINCKTCSLVPPNLNSPQPTTRERPPGCRTVFVGGLPENVTEDTIREVFERCGEITTLRLSKKNFCHIRYVFESSVDSAIYLSGYRIRLHGAPGSVTPTATEVTGNCGRLHVDYAQARDDQYEWECKQRQLQREQRHRDRMEQDRMRPHSPPPVVHYTDHEATAIAEKLKQDDHFQKAVQVLVTWLERGDCSKKNANHFYSMIQSSNSHVRRLQNEKSAFEEELQRAKDLYRKQMYNMCSQFTQIEKVFGAASHKKVWDHFTKAQRKNIDLWKKQSSEIRSMQLDEFRDNDEMDMSDDERDLPRSAKRTKLDNQSLLMENDNLKSELASYRSDADMVKSMLELDTDVKEKQLKVLQETIRNMQTQLLENKSREKETLGRIIDLEARLKQANVKELLLKTKIVEASKNSAASTISMKSSDPESDEAVDTMSTTSEISRTPLVASPPLNSVAHTKSRTMDTDDARIVGLVSTFLVVHPFGASLDYVFAYVHRSCPAIRLKKLEEILTRYKSIFSEEVTGVGAKIERKWKFCGFENDPTTTGGDD